MLLSRLSLVLINLLFITACASNAAPTPSPVPPTAVPSTSPPEPTVNVAQAVEAQLPDSPPTDESGNVLVARVNGDGITQSEFERALVRAQQEMQAADPTALEKVVLDSLIEQRLIEQSASDQNIVVSADAIESEFQFNREIAASDAAWQQWLTENQYTEEEFRATIHAMLIAGAMRDQVTQQLPENVPQVHARHILVETEAEANAVMTRLGSGEDFVALAASLSKDVTTREQGGDLGWFVEGELLEPLLTQVAFNLNAGEIGGPVATRLGYHVVQTLERAERPVTPEKQALLAQIHFENWLRGLTFNAVIERYLP
jgi:peptidyl-prolyl cis-trans isomerase C